MYFKSLTIGNLLSKIPIIQGGMGVGVSLSGLASAVACEGGIGVISAAHPGYIEAGFEQNPLKTNLEALAKHITIAKEKAKDGLIGVNIMSALKNYEEYVKCCVESKADIIFSGAGFPMNLPALVKNSTAKIAPIVSSVKAASVLFKIWEKRYNSTADIVVIEGPKAGGHLGFKPEELESDENFDNEIIKIVEFVKTYENKFNKSIPVVFGGGISTKEDVLHYLNLGCSGIQVATKFVATDECDAHINFKNAYVNAKKEDIGIVKSPVGLPGRAIINNFVRETRNGNLKVGKCYNCLIPCNPKDTPYCITSALIASVKGDVENGLVFCGADAYKIDRISTVKEVIKELTP